MRSVWAVVAGILFIVVVLTRDANLGPSWYPVLLVVLALPQSWAGAKVHGRSARRSAGP
jgi:hypothetical protein